jgi:hypothetical protein
MTEHEQNLRDLAAMFAMCGLVMNDDLPDDTRELSEMAYQIYNQFIEVRSAENATLEEDQGIAVLKPKRKYERKTAN